MKKRSLVTKEAVNRQHYYPGRPSHTHNPPNNFPQHQTQPKGRMYMIVQRIVAYVRDFLPKICMYTRLLAKILHVYVTFGQKPVYVHNFYPKSNVYREESGKK